MSNNQLIVKEKRNDLALSGMNSIVKFDFIDSVFNDPPTEVFPIIKTLLSDGEITINGKKMMVPVGSGGSMTVKEFRRMAKIPRNHDVFVINEHGALYVNNSDDIDLYDGATFSHRKPQPAAPVCVPVRFGR